MMPTPAISGHNPETLTKPTQQKTMKTATITVTFTSYEDLRIALDSLVEAHGQTGEGVAYYSVNPNDAIYESDDDDDVEEVQRQIDACDE